MLSLFDFKNIHKNEKFNLPSINFITIGFM